LSDPSVKSALVLPFLRTVIDPAVLWTTNSTSKDVHVFIDEMAPVYNANVVPALDGTVPAYNAMSPFPLIATPHWFVAPSASCNVKLLALAVPPKELTVIANTK
jgi:hypothetical protein